MTTLRAFALLLLGLWLIPAVALAQTIPPKITGLGQDTLEIKAKSGEDTADAYVSVLNASTTGGTIRASFQAASTDKVVVSAVEPRRVRPDGATRVKVTLAGLEELSGDAVDGQIVVLGGEEPVARAASITPAPQPWANWPAVLLIGTAVSVAILALLVIGRAFNKGTQAKLGGRAPGANWSFDSWATTLTAAGAILGTVLGSITLPPGPSEIDKDTLVQLNLLFGALIVVGPFLVQAIRKPSATEDEVTAGLWGYSPVLLLSYSITGAAVLGELGALALLGWELTGAAGFWSWACVVAALGLGLLAAYYFAVTAYEQVTTDWVDKAAKAKAAASKPAKVIVVEEGAVAPPKPVQTRQYARMP
jgi:hypothetical protein